jgi:N-acetylglucosaminyl-diphospho-decaprenol L-rhamnosyltransferase
MSDVAVIVVHYHTAALAVQAVAAVREDCLHSSIAHDLIVVDNGSDPAGAAALEATGVRIVRPAHNLGYAGAINAGVRSASAASLIAMNADVVVRLGCIRALLDELHAGAAVAGPRFHWDRAGRLLLPPTERRDLLSEALSRVSARGPRWSTIARRRWRSHARRHWRADRSIDSIALSGALLAFRRDANDAVGGFDDGFALYFEETEWLSRLARQGYRGRYVPGARAHHLYNSSARHHERAQEWFAASARRFEGREFGRVAAEWLRRLQPRHAPARHEASLPAAAPVLPRQERGTWLEISSGPNGYPAAGERLEDDCDGWRLPNDVWEHLSPGTYAVRAVSDAGRELMTIGFRR